MEKPERQTWPPEGVKWYYSDEWCAIAHGDCRDVLLKLPQVDLILTDPPYGITNNEWDRPVEHLLEYLIKVSNMVIVTASQPYSSILVSENLSMFQHEWIWLKNRGSNFANTVREPMKEHEHILVFSSGKTTYHPQMQERSGAGSERVKNKVAFRGKSSNYREFEGRAATMLPQLRVPSSVQFFETEVGLHPTQKPLSLLTYLILTYSNLDEIILDPFLGSGTTCFAAKQLGRKSIGIEIEERYCEIAARRLSQGVLELK